MKLRELLKRVRLRPLQGVGRRPVGNVDALAARPGQKVDPMGGVSSSAPPGYVPGADEGRPRH